MSVLVALILGALIGCVYAVVETWVSKKLAGDVKVHKLPDPKLKAPENG